MLKRLSNMEIQVGFCSKHRKHDLRREAADQEMLMSSENKT